MMILPDGRPRGMKLVLQERGIDTDRMKAADMPLVLGNHDDFKFEKTASRSIFYEREVIEYCSSRSSTANLIPLRARVWGKAQRYTCQALQLYLCRSGMHCIIIVSGLEAVRLDTVRRYFRKCREYMQAYRDSNTGGADVEQAVKLNKSHH